jgi:hypothetical protein
MIVNLIWVWFLLNSLVLVMPVISRRFVARDCGRRDVPMVAIIDHMDWRVQNPVSFESRASRPEQHTHEHNHRDRRMVGRRRLPLTCL